MSDYPENGGPLPAEKLCNKFEPNPIQGLGPLGNETAGRMHYSGGDKKELVLRLQKMLVALGYDLGDSGDDGDGADGDFGKKTDEAVKDFQQQNKDWKGEPLAVEGLVGPETSDALNRKMVGAWYDHYQTPAELTEGVPIHTVTSKLLQAGFALDTTNAEKAKVFIAGPLEAIWRAAWERPGEPASTGDKRRMTLRAPGLPDGEKVLFTVIQEAQGKKVSVEPPIEAVSRDGAAEAAFEAWYSGERVTSYTRLQEPEKFPPVKFGFTVKTPDREVECKKPLEFSGSYATKVSMQVEDTVEPLDDIEYVLLSPWGRRVGYTGENGEISLENLPPGGVSIAIGGEVLVVRK